MHGIGKTANQVVAANVRAALDEKRRANEKEWTYERVAQRLTDNGLPQTRQNVHRRFTGEAGKESAFTANELLAFSRVFEKPIVWFLLPQPHHRVVGASEERKALPVSAYLDRLFADPRGDVARRLEEIGKSEALQDQRALQDQYVAAELGDLAEVERTLRALADRFSVASHAVHTSLARAFADQPKGLPVYPDVSDVEHPPSAAKAAELRRQHIANLKAELRRYEKEEK